MGKESCVVCGSNKLISLKRDSREGFQIALQKCKNCGHIAQPAESYEDIYSTGEFTEQARGQAKLPSSQKIKDLDKRALKRFEYYSKYTNNFQNVLEVGSSIGSFVHILKLAGKAATGLEPDPDYAAYSQEQYGFEQHSCMLEDFNSDKKFDVVCSFHVLEHVLDPHTFIEKCHDLLNINGHLLFEFPSLELHMYGSMKDTIWKPHIHYFNAASVYQLFSRYFKVKKIGYYGSALFVYAQKTENPSFSSARFNALKLRSKVNYSIAKLFPELPVKTAGITAKQLLLQSTIFQFNKSAMLKKVWKSGNFYFKAKRYLKRERNGSGKTVATHVSYYSAWENAGDTVLSKCVRDNFNLINQDIRWNLIKVTDPVTEKTIEEINKGEFLVIGGGGLLLPDSNPNTISGWQWAVSPEFLEKIEVPIFVYAIGYNFFHGQEPGELFINSVKQLINSASFFSLRNYGSINKLKELVGPELGEKIHYQPCPTTFIRKVDKIGPKKSSKSVGVNIAFDRYKNRFGGDIYEILRRVAMGLKRIHEEGYKIYSICHLREDAKFELMMKHVGVPFESVDLQLSTPAETYEVYNNMEVVFGARGHAQMIPFGVNCKIISLGSHNKLKWFLDDIDAVDWFVNLKEDVSNLDTNLFNAFNELMQNKTQNETRLEENQQKLFEVTKGNLSRIEETLNQKN
jgi:SAM-dependent methyltransferase